MGHWGPTQHVEVNHTVTSAEVTAAKAIVDINVSGIPKRIRILSLSGYNSTTFFKQFMMGFRPEKGLSLGGTDVGTYTILWSGRCTKNRSDAVYNGPLIVDMYNFWCEARDPVLADVIYFRATWQTWVD